MRLLTYRGRGGGARLGVLDVHDRVHDVTSAGAGSSLVEVVTRWGNGARERIEEACRTSPGVPLSDVELLAPIPRPQRNVFCVGRNYSEHAKEFGGSGYDAGADLDANADHVPSHPVVFTKPPSSVVGPDALIDSHPNVTKELDYEGELAVIVGTGGRDITADCAATHVWGYTIVNDITARDRQRDHKQWFLGKGLDTFCPMGPFAVTADEVDADGHARPNLKIECRVNGELRQQASTLDLIFDIPALIETISAGMTLEPGDVIATGTPAGVGIGFDPPRFLQSGDTLEVSITGLGTLRNRID
jgi:2-keto-4-pentenoate hydratase/2-oxohepta-3-ene-1,7-dioic acid hydratase in catechol pathway